MSCTHIEKLREQFDFPFYYPVFIERKEENGKRQNNLVSGKLAIRLFKSTRGGKPTLKNGASAYIEYCPFCGKKLIEGGENAILRP